MTTSSPLDQLSDEVLLMILHKLGPRDLYSAMRCCLRLQNLCLDDRLWVTVEALPETRGAYETSLSLIGPRTRKLHLTSKTHPTNRGYRSSLPPSLITNLSRVGGGLSELHLDNQLLDGRTFRLHDLPKNLRVLSMQHAVIRHCDTHYLKDLSLHFTSLRSLNLSHTNFITAHSLLALSKLDKLERLYLRGCRKIGECLAYVALAARFGFGSLKVLDVTDTKVGSPEFTSFLGIPTLETFLCGQYDRYVDHDSNYITDGDVGRARGAGNLRELDLSGARVTDSSLDTFETMAGLLKVTAHFTGISKEGVEAWRGRSRSRCVVEVTESPVNPPVPQGNLQQGYRVGVGDNVIVIGGDNYN